MIIIALVVIMVIISAILLIRVCLYILGFAAHLVYHLPG